MFGVLFNSITDNASLTAAISRQPLNELGVATAGGAIITNVLAVFKMVSNFVTSGLAQPFGNLIVPCDDVFQVGDPLYLNLAIAGTLAPDIDVILVCDE